MTLTEALTLCLVMLPLAAMPSASVALVVARTVSAGRAHGALCAMGIVVGDLVFVGVALLGVGLLAGWLGAFFGVLKYLGGAYLIWLGYRLITTRASAALPSAGRVSPSLVGDFLAGLLLTLGDVKAILFYASLLPSVVDMAQLDWWDVLVISTITVVTVGGVKLVYVVFAARVVEKLRGRVASQAPRTLGGALMIACGSLLVAKA